MNVKQEKGDKIKKANNVTTAVASHTVSLREKSSCEKPDPRKRHSTLFDERSSNVKHTCGGVFRNGNKYQQGLQPECPKALTLPAKLLDDTPQTSPEINKRPTSLVDLSCSSSSAGRELNTLIPSNKMSSNSPSTGETSTLPRSSIDPLSHSPSSKKFTSLVTSKFKRPDRSPSFHKYKSQIGNKFKMSPLYSSQATPSPLHIDRSNISASMREKIVLPESFECNSLSAIGTERIRTTQSPTDIYEFPPSKNSSNILPPLPFKRSSSIPTSTFELNSQISSSDKKQKPRKILPVFQWDASADSEQRERALKRQRSFNLRRSRKLANSLIISKIPEESEVNFNETVTLSPGQKDCNKERQPLQRHRVHRQIQRSQSLCSLKKPDDNLMSFHSFGLMPGKTETLVLSENNARIPLSPPAPVLGPLPALPNFEKRSKYKISQLNLSESKLSSVTSQYNSNCSSNSLQKEHTTGRKHSPLPIINKDTAIYSMTSDGNHTFAMQRTKHYRKYAMRKKRKPAKINTSPEVTNENASDDTDCDISHKQCRDEASFNVFTDNLSEDFIEQSSSKFNSADSCESLNEFSIPFNVFSIMASQFNYHDYSSSEGNNSKIQQNSYFVRNHKRTRSCNEAPCSNIYDGNKGFFRSNSDNCLSSLPKTRKGKSTFYFNIDSLSEISVNGILDNGETSSLFIREIPSKSCTNVEPQMPNSNNANIKFQEDKIKSNGQNKKYTPKFNKRKSSLTLQTLPGFQGKSFVPTFYHDMTKCKGSYVNTALSLRLLIN